MTVHSSPAVSGEGVVAVEPASVPDGSARRGSAQRSWLHRLFFGRMDRIEELERRSNKRLRSIERKYNNRLEEIKGEMSDLNRYLRIPKRGQPTDARFLEAASLVRAHGRTKLDPDRLWMLWQAADNTRRLGLAVAEVGTYRGGSAYFLALAHLILNGSEVELDAIDTFEGHPVDKLSAVDPPSHKTEGAFARTSYEQVAGYLSRFERTTVHKGELSAIAPSLPDRRYGLVHLDVDLLESTRDCLAFFVDRVAVGGVIVLDDYDAPNCPGVRQAAEELLAHDARWQTWQPHTEQLVLVKIDA